MSEPYNELLIKVMLDRDVSGSQLSEKTGLHETTISKIINGLAKPHATTIIILCDALKATPQELGL